MTWPEVVDDAMFMLLVAWLAWLVFRWFTR